MPLTRRNTRTFHRSLYAGELESIEILKRDDDQRQGTVRRVKLFQCRRSRIERSGQMVQSDNQFDHHTIWHIPRIELDRTGIDHLNPIDRIIQLEGREKGFTWQPEATTIIAEKLFGNMMALVCLRTDPPK